ncbi:MAG: type II toxin-antitoxin system death-on-curing family toxin [Ardenticatenales bacterium]|nr:type II toxin-antitoxin system death-on-curing family toxin [Ardenticatenales bacterium]
MKEPAWLKREWVDALHFQQLKRFGGAYGVRDDGAVESALARPRNRLAHDDASDLAALAAEYGFGLARNHGYTDGNKRVAFLAMAVFLELNGLRLEAPETDVVRTIIGLAAGDINEPSLADWLRSHVTALDGDVDPGSVA